MAGERKVTGFGQADEGKMPEGITKIISEAAEIAEDAFGETMTAAAGGEAPKAAESARDKGAAQVENLDAAEIAAAENADSARVDKILQDDEDGAVAVVGGRGDVAEPELGDENSAEISQSKESNSKSKSADGEPTESKPAIRRGGAKPAVKKSAKSKKSADGKQSKKRATIKRSAVQSTEAKRAPQKPTEKKSAQSEQNEAKVISAENASRENVNVETIRRVNRQSKNYTKSFILFISAMAYLVPFLPFIVCWQEPFAKFHLNQALVLWIFAGTLYLVFGFIPVINLVALAIILTLHIVYIAAGISSAVRGKAKKLPLIGGIKLIDYKKVD